jgi:hypothetical protein
VSDRDHLITIRDPNWSPLMIANIWSLRERAVYRAMYPHDLCGPRPHLWHRPGWMWWHAAVRQLQRGHGL